MRGRGAAAAGMLCLLLAACQQEPDFDERYQAAQKKIREKAVEIDSALAKAERERAARASATASREVSITRD
jgi:hypothetical protein